MWEIQFGGFKTMVEEQDIMQHDDNNNSDENAILTALTLAIKNVMRYEGKLLEIKCSEHAIVQWYFTKEDVTIRPAMFFA